jgi:hypothetical protein
MWSYLYNFILSNISLLVESDKIILVIKKFSSESLHVYIIRGKK